MIAAIAKVNGLTLATRNTRDFERFRVPLVNPFIYRS
jgi:predicted nucleic acid-binding protein